MALPLLPRGWGISQGGMMLKSAVHQVHCHTATWLGGGVESTTLPHPHTSSEVGLH
jgi:hypothetical protein